MSRGAPGTGHAPPSGAARVRLLDGFDLSQGGRSTALPPQTQRLVALLALRGRPAQRSLLAGQLWPDASEAEALARLRSALWRLRQRRCPVVETRDGRMQLAPGTAVDAVELESWARRLLDPAAPLRPEEEDPGRWGCDLLPDWWEEWVVVERERLRQLRLHALEQLAERLVASRRFARALDVALAAVAVEPLRESPHRLVVSTHLAEGNRSEALRAYEGYRELLRAELGVDPSPSMEQLVGDLRGRDDGVPAREGVRGTSLT